MSNLTPVSGLDNVPAWDLVTPLLGGDSTAPLNRQAQALLNRIQWLIDNSALDSDLIDTSDADNGAGAIGFGPNTQYVFGSVGAKLLERKSFLDFLSASEYHDVISGTNALDLASAFADARTWAVAVDAAGRIPAIEWPSYKYKASAFPNWDVKNLHLESIGRPEWICTGTGPIMRRDGSAGWIYGQVIGDFILTGNALCAIGYLACKTTHSVIGRIRVRNVSGIGAQIALGVLEFYQTLECSINADPSMSPIPARGLQVTHFSGESTTAVVFANVIMEGQVQGIDMPAADNVLFLAGTAEACSVRGGNTAAACKGITLQNFSCEANGTQDWLNFGRMVGFLGGYYGKAIDNIGARLYVVDRALLQSVTSDATTSGEIRNCEFSYFAAGGSITPSAGAVVTRRNNWNVDLGVRTDFGPLELANPTRTYGAIAGPITASPYVYTNTSVYAEEIVVRNAAGTVTLVRAIDIAGTPTPVGGTQGLTACNTYFLMPGEGLEVNYTGTTGTIEMIRKPR